MHNIIWQCYSSFIKIPLICILDLSSDPKNKSGLKNSPILKRQHLKKLFSLWFDQKPSNVLYKKDYIGVENKIIDLKDGEND